MNPHLYLGHMEMGRKGVLDLEDYLNMWKSGRKFGWKERVQT
jgi:hypothetical protein